MQNPYRVLGVAPNASDEEIKQAYRELAKKYHPDNYANTPLADLVSEKMAEINDAYDRIQMERRNGTGAARQDAAGYGGYSGFSRQPSGALSDIRRLVSMGRISEAEELLDGIPFPSRDAEWNFLKGNVLYSRGFLEDSMQYFQNAVRMNPQNFEYRTTLDRLNAQRQFRGSVYSQGYSTCGPCSLCSALCCANCTCNVCRCCTGNF